MASVAAPPGRASEAAVARWTPEGRGVVDGMVNPHPLIDRLPAVLQDDEFCRRLTAALDEVVAPLHSVLDCFPAYLDADLTPEDFLDWLAGWVGIGLDENWPVARRRQLVHRMVELYAMRGTSAGLRAHVELYAGVTPEILENGGCLWSQTADTPLPGSPDPYLSVRLHAPAGTPVNQRTVERIVEASRPAHLACTVEIVTSRGSVVESAPPDEEAGGAAEDAPGAVDLPGTERIEMAAPGVESGEEPAGPEPGGPGGKEPSE